MHESQPDFEEQSPSVELFPGIDADWREFRSREEWLTAREQGIGASDAAAIMGVSHWSSPYRLWLEKSGLNDDRRTDDWLYSGNEHEAGVVAAYTRKTGRTLWRPASPGFFQRRDLPFIRSSIDGLAVNPTRPAEIKCVMQWGERHWAKGVPLQYQVQVQHEMFVLGAEVADVVAFFGSRMETVVFEVRRNEKFIERLISRCKEFWRQVQDGTPPDPDASEETRLAVQRRCAFVAEERRSAELPALLAHGIGRLAHVESLIGLLEAERNQIQSLTLEWLASAKANTGLVRGTPKVRVQKTGRLKVL